MKFEICGEEINLRRLVLLVILPLVCLGAAAAFFLPGSMVRLALMLLLVLPVVFLFIDRPTVVFCLLIIILFSNLDVFIAPVRAFRYILIFFLASFAVSIANGRRVVSHHPLMIALLAAFTILAFQSISVARDVDVSIVRLSAFLKILLYLGIISQFARDRKEFRRFLLFVAGGTLLSSLLPFVLRPPAHFASLSVLWGQGVVRYEGFVFEPNTFALFQIFVIPILIFFVGVFRKPAVARFLFMLAILASIAVLVLSFSRGGFIALACLLALLVVVERGNKPLLLFGFVLIAAGIMLFPGVYWERMRSMLDFGGRGQSDFAILTRLETMRTAFRLGLENPILGVGIDNFIYQSRHFIPYRLVVHNAFLQIFSELGFIACSVFLGIIAYNMAIIFRMMRNRGDAEAAQLGRALLMQQVAILVSSLFIPIAYDMVFWFALGLPAIADYAYRDKS